ncbi:MAG TPA: zinc-ribbon domain-containing protein, partial [Myxococcaceae bacterium]|nr:zinc-ribbon domain-containing protein [Myxococcaceae bacterium]
MRFRCEQCGTEYSLPDEAVARATRARCPRCKHSQVLHAGGVPLTTPGGGRSKIGRVALTTRPVDPEPEPEEELFGELDWETDSELDFVVGRSHVHFDQIPAAAPPPPVAPPPASLPPASLGSSSAPIDFSDVHIDEAEDPNQLRGGPEADAWPETERSDPWRTTPLPPVQRPQAPPTPVPSAGRPPQKTPPRAAPPAIPSGPPPPSPRS